MMSRRSSKDVSVGKMLSHHSIGGKERRMSNASAFGKGENSCVFSEIYAVHMTQLESVVVI